MSTIIITIYDGDTEKNILRSGIFPILKESGHRLVILIRGSKRLSYYKEHFESDNVIIDSMPSAISFAEHLWYHISWNSVPTHSSRLRRNLRFATDPNYFRWMGEYIAWQLSFYRPWRELLRRVYFLLPDSYAADILEKYKPDLVFCPNMFSPEDCRMLRAAKRRGIPTIATAKSWDVLTTKAFTRVKADALLVFNEFDQADAVRIGDYEEENVIVTGFPQFDVYTDLGMRMSREDFFGSLGLSSHVRLVLMAIPGDWLTPHTADILAELDARIEEGRFGNVKVLARLHPKYPDSSEKLTLRHVIFDRPGTHFSKATEFSIDMGVRNTFKWTFTDKDIRHLVNSLYHADVIINTASTLTLDATALGKPVILIGYDGDQKVPYWSSIRRVYERNHYKNVIDTKAAILVESHDALESALHTFLENPHHKQYERELLTSKLLYRIDGKASERMARAILARVH